MFIRRYGLATTVYVPIVKRAVVDFAVGADWTPVAGDVKISKDGGAAANIGSLPTAIAMGNGAMWAFTLTGTEMSANNIVITVADAATKAVEDQAIIIDTRWGPITAFMFMMTDSTNHNPVTGKTVTATRSIDGAAYAAGALGAVTEVAFGWYKLDIDAASLAGNNTTFRFTATASDDTFVNLVTLLG